MVENRFKSTEKWMKWENVKNESIVIYISSCMKKGFFSPPHCAGIYTLSVWNKWFLQSVSSNTSAGALCDLSSLISLYRPDHRFHWTSKEQLDDFKFFFLTVAFFFSFFFFHLAAIPHAPRKKLLKVHFSCAITAGSVRQGHNLPSEFPTSETRNTTM